MSEIVQMAELVANNSVLSYDSRETVSYVVDTSPTKSPGQRLRRYQRVGNLRGIANFSRPTSTRSFESAISELTDDDDDEEIVRGAVDWDDSDASRISCDSGRDAG
jgi:hypothetical protein